MIFFFLYFQARFWAVILFFSFLFFLKKVNCQVFIKALPLNSWILMWDVKYDSDRASLWLRGCVSLLVYACVSMRIITERRQTRRRKMNMLYGGSKILHGPSAREEPRAECLRLPNIINYLGAFTSAVFGQSGRSAALPALEWQLSSWILTTPLFHYS